MQRAHSHVGLWFFGLLSAALALNGCSGPNAGTPTAAGGSTLQSPAVAMAATNLFDGQYSGSVSDSTFGSGKASASLAQYEGSVGGTLAATFGKTVVLHSLAGNQTNQNLHGKTVATVGKNACAFDYTASYSSSSHKFSLHYYATARGCSGENGTIHMTKQCYYQEGAPQDVLAPENNMMRPNTGLRPC